MLAKGLHPYRRTRQLTSSDHLAQRCHLPPERPVTCCLPSYNWGSILAPEQRTYSSHLQSSKVRSRHASCEPICANDMWRLFWKNQHFAFSSWTTTSRSGNSSLPSS